jgi:hypothetical protein
MSLVVLAMAVALFALESRLLTTAAVLFTVVLLIPSVVVDVLVLFGPGAEAGGDPLLERYRSRPDPDRR